MEIGLPSAILMSVDGCGWNMLIFLAGYLGIVQQASQVLIANYVVAVYSVSSGL